jgi:hypothetical protein
MLEKPSLNNRFLNGFGLNGNDRGQKPRHGDGAGQRLTAYVSVLYFEVGYQLIKYMKFFYDDRLSLPPPFCPDSFHQNVIIHSLHHSGNGYSQNAPFGFLPRGGSHYFIVRNRLG